MSEMLDGMNANRKSDEWPAKGKKDFEMQLLALTTRNSLPSKEKDRTIIYRKY